MIRKAVIPAAGFGTRFLPATKSQPKEMLPIVDTPVIQYVVEEAVASGITDILIVIGKGKRAIEEHFDRNFYLEAQLMEQGKEEELQQIRKISELADIHFVWQKQLRGLGDAVNCARLHVGNEPFAVLLGDTLISSASPATQQLVDVYDRYEGSVVLIQQIDRARVSRYGVISGDEVAPGIFKIHGLVEKPTPQEAPSTLAVAGRYVFTPDIFDCLAKIKPGKGGELQLTDAMQLMLAKKPMYGRLLDGKRYDIGDKQGFIKTNIEFALKDEDICGELKDYIKQLAKEL
ncbi:MAG TPA: UTP--glucose-1-phosphate uridylyltransferase GalU [Sedimentisphaerales bacterium]|nr:UTP--glucose-1-phosphate uridylyltransferase GalU [Sedimentisphaerales bacterium]